MKLALTLTTLTVLAFSSLASAQANLIVNGDFESDAYTVGSADPLTQTDRQLPGWTILDPTTGPVDQSDVAGIGTGFNGNTSQELDLSGFSDGVSGISQGISTTIGEEYVVSFDAYTANYGNGLIDLFIDGVLEIQVTGDRSAPVTHMFTATDTTTRIGFISNGGNVSQIDNVSVSSTAPVPEPASVVALGLGGLAVLRRRKARN